MDRPGTIASAIGLAVGLLMLFTAYSVSISMAVSAETAPRIILGLMACMGLSALAGVGSASAGCVASSRHPGL